MKKVDLKARYFETNEWVRQDEDGITIGITDFAQTVFGNVVFTEIEEVGKIIEKGKRIAIIESDKTTTDLFSPLSGKIIAINKKLETTPSLLNASPYEEGWLVKMELTNRKEWEKMMDAKDYQAYMSIFYNKI